MANDCYYKMIVKGKKNACYAFMGGQHRYYQDIEREEGTNEDYEIMFSGSCKWTVDQYTEDYTGKTPVEIPDDPEKAEEEAGNNAGYNIRSRSAMYNVEVMCNSHDEFESDCQYEHYKNGRPVASDVPEELRFSCEREGDGEINNITYEEGQATALSEKFNQEKSLTTDNGNRFYIKDNRLYLNEVFSVAVPDDAEFTVSEEESETAVVMAVPVDEDEKINIKFQFSCDDEDRCSKDKDEGFIYVDNDNCVIFCPNSFAVSQSFWDRVINNYNLSVGINVVIGSEKYYITAVAGVRYEAAVTTEFRILEEVLKTIVICGDSEEIKITRMSSGSISSLSDSLFSNNNSGSDDNDDDDSDDEDEE